MSAPPLERQSAARPTKSGKRQPKPFSITVRGHKIPIAPWALLAPSLILLAVMVGYPTIVMVINSFSDYQIKNKMTGTPANFVGFDNYIAIFSKGDFPAVLARSLGLMVVLTILILVGGMLCGLLMTKLTKGWRLLVSIGLLLAWAMPPLSATVVWGWIFDTNYGLVNWLLNTITGSETFYGHSWLMNPWSFMMVLVIIVVWQGIPFAAFTFYAGLGQIPGEVLEAAQLDGATPWQRFRFVVTPYMRNIITVVLILETIWNLRIFTQVYALQQRGGLASETNVLGTYLFRQGLGEFGITAAIGVVMVLLLMGISYFNVRNTLKEEEEL
ncbi:N,N'-diacetylchitobiose transport system permease protein [Arthrobacter stackebrandtii]|uniref:N,N'-diacetylchitobiose transport system permease protein n=1 Tax=Arthrobacter stackebrandtii TaxID=272161 RepID=A0ABS4YZ39_9MICC|nr:sugar ABC transporter permease [Arthrobacter stackebrandtii]MBP2414004.1 N,N'-diacetylchitobiose transport system permease protein [Arthrobacter stackebrandtii]PYG99014.1 sugar ABC transporter permease [Arthrobacter stackebrandtii]